VWWLLGGRKAAGIAWFLLLGSEQNELVVSGDGTLFLAQGGGEPVYAHWRGFVDQGDSFVLWGADGRYRLVIPKRALAPEDYATIESRVGVDLISLRSGEEARLEK